MSKYIFLTENFKDDFCPTFYYVIEKSSIENIKYSETYKRHGDQVGSYDTGDSVVFMSKKAVKVANRVIKENDYEDVYEIDDFIDGFQNHAFFDEVLCALEKECEEGVDYCTSSVYCKGFNYFDGRNYRTIITDCEQGDYSSHKIVDDEHLVDELNEVLENMEFSHENAGVKLYETDDYFIEDSAWEGVWEIFKIYSK